MQHPWDNSTIFYQQDKEGGINPAFAPRALRPSKQRSVAASFASPLRRALKQAGNPLCRV